MSEFFVIRIIFSVIKITSAFLMFRFHKNYEKTVQTIYERLMQINLSSEEGNQVKLMTYSMRTNEQKYYAQEVGKI